MEVTDEMIDAFGKAWHTEDEKAIHDRGSRRRAGLAAVLEIVERDYVSRWGYITERVPREFLNNPIMEGFKKSVHDHAEYMGAEVVDIDNPEILPDESSHTFGDFIWLKWKIRRTA